MIISVFNKLTGQILRICSVPANDVQNQCSTTEDYIVGAYPDDKFYISNGDVVSMGDKPSEHHVFDYKTKTWADPRTAETEWEVVRQKRASLLLASDWTQLPDVPTATKEIWITYRQALRDITQQPDPFNIIWPQQPQ